VLGPTFQGMGVFFVALEREFHWSRAILSGAFSLSRAEGALLGPVEGILTDRLGPRRMILIGFTILGAGFIGLSFINNVVGFYVAFLVIYTGAGLGGFVPMVAAVNNWFVRRRSLAMAIGITGISFAGLIVPVIAWIVTNLGWRLGSLGIGVAIWALAFPIVGLLKNKPEEYGLLPDGDIPDTALMESNAPIHEKEQSREINFTVGQALRTSAFWAITLAHLSGSVASTTLAIHLVPALTDAGMSLGLAAVVVATYQVIGLVFQLIGGLLGDRLPKEYLIALFTIIQGAGVMVLATVSGPGSVLLFAVLFGIGFGGRVPIIIALRSEYFGRKAFASIFGASLLPMNIGMMVAPLATGYFFDVQGNYMIPFVGLAILNFIGAALILLARKPVLPGEG
jgi:OFA family oxalate/formate antiporter-like MFS transporter